MESNENTTESNENIMEPIQNISRSADRIWEVVHEASTALSEFGQHDRWAVSPWGHPDNRALPTGEQSWGFDEKSLLRACFLALYQTAEPVFNPDTRLGEALASYTGIQRHSSTHDAAFEENRKKDLADWISLRGWTRLNPVEAAVSAVGLANDIITLMEINKSFGLDGDKIDWSAVNSSGAKLSGRVFKTAKQATESGDDILEEVCGMGSGYSPGGTDGLDLEDDVSVRITLAAAISRRKDISGLIEAFGRLIAKYDDESGDRAEQGLEHDDMTVGRDLESVLPSELAQEDDLFDAAFLDSKLNQYEMSTKMRKGLGPIIALIDKSGSMTGQLDANVGFSRDDFATALALTLARSARKTDRPIHIIGFCGEIRFEIGSETGKLSVDELSTLVGMVSRGGTDFRAPVKRGLAKLSAEPDADLVLLTDGDCPGQSSELWISSARSKLSEHKARMVGLNIGPMPKHSCLSLLCEEVVERIEVADKAEEAMELVFKRILDRRQHFLDSGWS